MLLKRFIFLLLIVGFALLSFSQDKTLKANDVSKGKEKLFQNEPSNQFYVDSLYDILGNARLMFSEDRNEEAIAIYRSVISACEHSKNKMCKEALIHAYNGLADIYLHQKLFDISLQYSSTSLNLAKSFGDDLILAMTQLYRGNILSAFFEENTNPVSNTPIDESYSILPARARAAYIKAANTIEQNGGKEQVHYVGILTKIGTTYIQEEKYPLAEEYYQQALELAEKLKSEKYSIFSLQNLAFIYGETNRNSESIDIGKDLLIRVDSSNRSMLSNIHYTLSGNYESLGQLQLALKHYKKYNFLKNIYNENEDQENLLAIKEKFENEKLNNENLELQASNLLAKNKAQRAYLLSGIAGVAFLLLLGASLLLSLRHQYQQQNLQLKIIRNEQDAEIRTINALIDGREKERSEIGRFLHDQVASLLNSANLHLEVMSHKFGIENPMYQKTQGILDDVADKVRTLSHKLLSDVLLKFGLTVALEDLCDRLTTPILEFNYTTNIERGKRYKKGIEDRLYTITQELTNNIIKHSQADKAFIILNETDNKLVVQVQDNGVGFKKEDVENGGTGLKQIGMRVKSLGGNMFIKTNELTSIRIEFPLHIARKRKNEDQEATIQFENH